MSEEVLKRLEELSKRLAALEGRVPPKHEHRFSDSKDGGVFCVDCGERYYRLDSFDDVLKRLKAHHEGDFLSCPSCRPKFIGLVKELGYEVKDYGGRLEIRKRR
ncbi:MAG: hypothetical protein QXK12_08695 [Candidatus Nezhaarchaeales archaeon]